jgi:hypothetical protein
MVWAFAFRPLSPFAFAPEEQGSLEEGKAASSLLSAAVFIVHEDGLIY